MCVVGGRIQINGQFRDVSLIKPEDYAKLNLHSLKWAADGDLRWIKTAARSRKHGWSSILATSDRIITTSTHRYFKNNLTDARIFIKAQVHAASIVRTYFHTCFGAYLYSAGTQRVCPFTAAILKTNNPSITAQ